MSKNEVTEEQMQRYIQAKKDKKIVVVSQMVDISSAASPEEVLADFHGDWYGALRYYALQHNVNIFKAIMPLYYADRAKVDRLLTQRRIFELSACPMCRGNNITVSVNTHTKSEPRSFLWNLLMLVLTGGLWLLWMLVRRRQEAVIETKSAVCQTCGYSWDIDY